MTHTPFEQQPCRRASMQLDAYLDGELLTETNLEMMEHFRRCPSCGGEAQNRRRLRARLQIAVRDVAIPAGLEDRIRGRIRGDNRPGGWSRGLMALAAGVAVCFSLWIGWQLALLRFTSAANQSYIAALSSQVAGILRVGLGDHIHCAALRRFGKNPILGLPAGFQDLPETVSGQMPGDLELAIAHECRFRGRKFIHLAYRNANGPLSFVIARKQDAESFQGAGLGAVLSRSGIPVYAAGVQRFQVAAFESRDFLVYTISGEAPQRNLALMAAVAPAVRQFLDARP